MKLQLAGACLLATLGLATAAMADSQTTITLQQPLAKHVDFIVNGAMWRCDGATCAAFVPEQTLGVGQCHSVALKVGPVASAQNDAHTLASDQLDKCNTGIVSHTTVASAH
ncbi:MAG TPA: hypothetical protein VHW60_09030 [Caulobacteraceae bacterium]|jgi:hypothetical protein|nr:hypothetical protein [Caulobacteraceae bacterium]